MKVRAHKKIGRYIRRFFRRKVLSRYGKGILAVTKNGYLVVDPGDFGVSRSLLEKGEYDSAHIGWLKSIIGESAERIIFVGSHIGSLLIPLSANAKTVIGYEADPENYELLKMNIALNNVENARVYNKAVGERTGHAVVLRNTLNTGNSSVSESNNLEGSIEMVSLDAALAPQSQEQIDLVVMDIEGHELHALRGATKVLEKLLFLDIEYAPEQLEEHGSDPMELLNLLFGYFDYMYIFDNKPTRYDKAEAIGFLKNNMKRRGFLLNLFFSKQEVPAGEYHSG